MGKRRSSANSRLGSAARAFLVAATSQVQNLSTSVEVLRNGTWARLNFELTSHVVVSVSGGLTARGKTCSVEDSHGFKKCIHLASPNDCEMLWLDLIARWHGGVVDPSTTKLDIWLDRNAKKKLRELATLAWAELFGTQLTADQKAGNATTANRDMQAASVESILQTLRS